jgi:hypothetical protein
MPRKPKNAKKVLVLSLFMGSFYKLFDKIVKFGFGKIRILFLLYPQPVRRLPLLDYLTIVEQR